MPDKMPDRMSEYMSDGMSLGGDPSKKVIFVVSVSHIDILASPTMQRRPAKTCSTLNLQVVLVLRGQKPDFPQWIMTDYDNPQYIE
jgi:hypothetical protein